MGPINHIGEMIEQIEKNYDNPRALNIKTEYGWNNISTKSFLYDVKRLVYGLIHLGVRRGDKVGLLANSSPYWTIADLAIMIAGGVTVPLFSNISSTNFIYEIAQSNVRHLFIAGVEQWEMYSQHRHLFEMAIGFDPLTPQIGAIKYGDLLMLGEDLWGREPELFDKLLKQINADDIATIIYTSGSTGLPKGAMLSHRNLTHLINKDDFEWDSMKDRYLSFLPLAHVFARQINLIMIGRGISVYYLNELSALAQTCKEVHPTCMIVVPRILEKTYSVMVGALRKSKGIKRRIGEWAFRLANDPSTSLFKRWILRPIADKLVYTRLRESLGGKFRVILSGGAALDPNLYRFYLNVGIPIYEGWGQTEASTICVNRPGKIKIGTVGTPLPGSEVKISEKGEILVKGPTVMKGYYRNGTSTEEALDDQGWLHTGDKGEMDEEGYLKIFGRITAQFKLSTGEYVNPEQIENALNASPLIDRAMVIGEKKRFPAVLIFPDLDHLQKLKEDFNQSQLSDEDFIQTTFFQEEINQLLVKVNRGINSWSRIEHYQCIPHTPTVEGGELSPNLQLKRQFIKDKYHHLIEIIYPEEAAV